MPAPRRKGDDEPLEAGDAAKGAVAETEPKEDAIEFPIGRFLGPDGHSLTGYEPHVLAGALYDVSNKNLTVEEAKAACKAWLEAPEKEA